MENGFLDNFVLPDGAAEAIKRAGISSQRLADGVEMMNFGHDKGVAYRFFVHQERNEAKSKAAKIPIPDSIEMIEWSPDRFQKPTERLKFLPHELLAFEYELDAEGKEIPGTGVCIGGIYKPTYDAWKKGLNAPGLSLNKWGVLSDADIFTLHEMRIYSVEQFAAQPRTKVDRLPAEIIEAFEQAIEYVNGKSLREATSEMAGQMVAMKADHARMIAEMEELKAQLAAKKDGPAKKRKRGPNKVTVVAGEIKEGAE